MCAGRSPHPFWPVVTSLFTGQGTNRWLAGAGLDGLAQFSAPPAFNNNGLVDLSGGQLALFSGTNTGEFLQAPGTLLWFWGGNYALDGGTTFTGSNAVRIAQGAAAATCLVNETITVASLELGLNGRLEATGAGPGNTNAIGSLVAHDNGLITNGTFAVQNLQVLDRGTVASCAITVETSLEVSATNGSVDASSLSLQAGAPGVLHPGPGGAAAKLNLTQGTLFQAAGQLTLRDGSLIAGSGLPQSQLLVQPGGSLVCTNSATVTVNLKTAGTVEVNSGTLAFQGAWNKPRV